MQYVMSANGDICVSRRLCVYLECAEDGVRFSAADACKHDLFVASPTYPKERYIQGQTIRDKVNHSWGISPRNYVAMYSISKL